MEKNIQRTRVGTNIKDSGFFIAASAKIRAAQKWFIPTVIYGYAFLYMYTGYDKLINVERFIQGNAKIPFIGQFAEITGWGIPILEVTLALLLIMPVKKVQRQSLLISTILMGFFTLYVALILAFVESKPCNCGGVIESMGWNVHLIFNILWLVAGIYALVKINKITHFKNLKP